MNIVPATPSEHEFLVGQDGSRIRKSVISRYWESGSEDYPLIVAVTPHAKNHYLYFEMSIDEFDELMGQVINPSDSVLESPSLGRESNLL